MFINYNMLMIAFLLGLEKKNFRTVHPGKGNLGTPSLTRLLHTHVFSM